MAAHYGKERSKYGTLTGSVITWPVEVLSPNDPNNPDAVAKLLQVTYVVMEGNIMLMTIQI